MRNPAPEIRRSSAFSGAPNGSKPANTNPDVTRIGSARAGTAQQQNAMRNATDRKMAGALLIVALTLLRDGVRYSAVAQSKGHSEGCRPVPMATTTVLEHSFGDKIQFALIGDAAASTCRGPQGVERSDRDQSDRINRRD